MKLDATDISETMTYQPSKDKIEARSRSTGRNGTPPPLHAQTGCMAGAGMGGMTDGLRRHSRYRFAATTTEAQNVQVFQETRLLSFCYPLNS